jgi:hypothetical protein
LNNPKVNEFVNALCAVFHRLERCGFEGNDTPKGFQPPFGAELEDPPKAGKQLAGVQDR